MPYPASWGGRAAPTRARGRQTESHGAVRTPRAKDCGSDSAPDPSLRPGSRPLESALLVSLLKIQLYLYTTWRHLSSGEGRAGQLSAWSGGGGSIPPRTAVSRADRTEVDLNRRKPTQGGAVGGVSLVLGATDPGGANPFGPGT
jgi:hypothetical protein